MNRRQRKSYEEQQAIWCICSGHSAEFWEFFDDFLYKRGVFQHLPIKCALISSNDVVRRENRVVIRFGGRVLNETTLNTLKNHLADDIRKLGKEFSATNPWLKEIFLFTSFSGFNGGFHSSCCFDYPISTT